MLTVLQGSSRDEVRRPEGAARLCLCLCLSLSLSHTLLLNSLMNSFRHSSHLCERRELPQTDLGSCEFCRASLQPLIRVRDLASLDCIRPHSEGGRQPLWANSWENGPAVMHVRDSPSEQKHVGESIQTGHLLQGSWQLTYFNYLKKTGVFLG